MTSHPRVGALLGLSLLLSAACADLPALLSLRTALNREFPDTPIGVRLTDESLLTVTIANSPLRHASCEARVAYALRVAAVAGNHYPGFRSLRVVSIEFVSPLTRDSMAQDAPHLPIRFSPDGLGTGSLAAESTQAVGACRSWDELR